MREWTNVQHNLPDQAVGNGQLPYNVVFPSAESRQDQESNGQITVIING